LTAPEPPAIDRHAVLERAITALARIRSERPRVHCLTNFVAQNLSANALLAAGAVPSMTMDAGVMADFVGSSRALLINLGQLDPWRKEASLAATDAAAELGRPWLLDPVKVDRAPARLAFARDLIARGPALLRCNRDEARTLGAAPGTVLAVTGEVDRISDGDRRLEIANGSPLMDRVTAMGCAASALIAAFLAVEEDAFAAAVSALLVFDIAGEIAGERARGPGSLEIELLDALYRLEAADIEKRARLA